jgi:phosphoglycerol transferase MdoB-like AlkP superfamily enzyme
MKSWNRFFRQLQKDVKLWMFCFLSFGVYRAAFIYYFKDKIGASTSVKDFERVFISGFRYDSMAATAWVIAPFLLSVLNGFVDFAEKTDVIRRGWGEIFCVLFSGACVVTVNYFKEFNDQFNHFMANMLYDNAFAVIHIIWSDYHLPDNFLIISLMTIVLVIIVRQTVSREFLSELTAQKYFSNNSIRILVSLLTVILLSMGLRGSFGFHPIRRVDAVVSDDAFLNKAAINPFLAFYFTVTDYVRQNDVSEGLDEFLPDHNVKRAARKAFSNGVDSDNLDDYFVKIAPGFGNSPPRHIFFVVMESYDAWPLLDKYRTLHLADNLSRMARHGLFVRNFISSGDGTGESLAAIITGLPITTINISESIRSYPTSIAATFKRLGYKTNLFYGGNDTWLNLNKFGPLQGFDKVYGANKMRSKETSEAWHIPDEYLFRYILTKIDDSHPSFNVIMTTSYHAPYIVDVYKKGFPLKKVPSKFYPDPDNPVNLRELGHLWYADQCLGSFVREAEHRLSGVLFAVTGDHFSRRFINSHPDYYERTAVPFVLYGKNILNGVHFPKNVAGSHLDIGPTLVELSAPKGFRYYSMGTSLLRADHRHVGIGHYKIMGPAFMVDLSARAKIYPLRDIPLPKHLPEISSMRLLFDRMYAISWWRVIHGPQLK